MILSYTILKEIRHRFGGNDRDPEDMKYYERIRAIREDRSFTQQKIADLLHIGQRTYSDYESGRTRIPIDSLLKLAKYYDVSMDYISGASNINTGYPKK